MDCWKKIVSTNLKNGSFPEVVDTFPYTILIIYDFPASVRKSFLQINMFCTVCERNGRRASWIKKKLKTKKKKKK